MQPPLRNVGNVGNRALPPAPHLRCPALPPPPGLPAQHLSECSVASLSRLDDASSWAYGERELSRMV